MLQLNLTNNNKQVDFEWYTNNSGHIVFPEDKWPRGFPSRIKVITYADTCGPFYHTLIHVGEGVFKADTPLGKGEFCRVVFNLDSYVSEFQSFLFNYKKDVENKAAELRDYYLATINRLLTGRELISTYSNPIKQVKDEVNTLEKRVAELAQNLSNARHAVTLLDRARVRSNVA